MKNITKRKDIETRDLESVVGKFLRFGVIASSIIVLIGGISFLVQSGTFNRPDYNQFKGETSDFVNLSKIITNVSSLSPMAIIQFGVLILILTPILRIFLSLLTFIWEKDRLYILITLIVMCIILASTFGGLKI